MLEINGKDVNEVVKDGAVVIDCWAPWCPTCRMMMPNIEKLEEENNGKVKFYKINMDENQDFAKSHDVFSLPTLLFYKDSVEVERTTGFKQKVQINAILEKIR